jgi:hypothetical protein
VRPTHRIATFLALVALGACADEPIDQPSTPQPVTVRVSWCSGLEPDWVAFQDGDGAWTRAMPVATGDTTTYQYVFQANRGGIATLTEYGGPLTQLAVLFGSPAEIVIPGNTKTVYCGTPASKTLLGTVAGLGANESAVIGGHLSRITATSAVGDTFALQGLGGGPHDVLAARLTQTGSETAVTSFIVRRAVDLPDSTVLPVLNFSSAEAIVPITASVTVGGLGPEGASTAIRVLTRTTEVLLSPLPTASLDVTRSYAALPLSELQGDDIQEIVASALNGGASRTLLFYFLAPANRVIAIPAALTRPTIDTVATTPALRLRARFVAQADFDRERTISYQQGTSTIVSVAMTAAYSALLANGYELIVPDLSGVAGFNSTWALHPGAKIIWTAGGFGGTLGPGANAKPADGSIQRLAFDTDSLPGL